MSVQGPGPGSRYGHVMALVGQRYLMAIGGNDGKLVTLECYPIYIFFLVCVSGNLMDATLVSSFLSRKETFG